MTTQYMTGEQINRLFKTLKAITTTTRLSENVAAYHRDKVSLLKVSHRNGKPVFGTVAEDYLIDVALVANTKFDRHAGYAVSVQDDEIRFENDDETYSFNLIEPEDAPEKLPVLTDSGEHHSTSAKKLLGMVKKAAQVDPDVSLCASYNGVLTVSALNVDRSFVGRIRPGKHDVTSQFPETRIDSAYLTPALATVSNNVNIKVTDQGPLMLSWFDIWYDYVLYIAPKIKME